MRIEFSNLKALEPRLAALEADIIAHTAAQPHPYSDFQFYEDWYGYPALRAGHPRPHGFKGRLEELVGFLAQTDIDELRGACDAYDVAHKHLFNLLASSTGEAA